MFWPESSITLFGLYFNDNDDNDERRVVLVHIYINSNWLTELITIHGQKQNNYKHTNLCRSSKRNNGTTDLMMSTAFTLDGKTSVYWWEGWSILREIQEKLWKSTGKSAAVFFIIRLCIIYSIFYWWKKTITIRTTKCHYNNNNLGQK